MSESFWIALLVGVGSPLLLAILTNWNKSRERAEDRADRQAAAALLAQVGTKIDGMLVDRDKAKVLEGERRGVMAGEATARTLAEGQRQGRETQSNPLASVPVVPALPLPVADEKTAAGVAQVVEAIQEVASGLSQKT